MDDRGGALDRLIHRGAHDELLFEIDRRCDTRDWDGLVTLRDRCDAAVEQGRQLWSVARFAEYRLALEAPGGFAAAVCRTGSGRFTLGPLTEVAASVHTWGELADGIDAPWVAATVAQERVLRGEDLRGDDRTHAGELDLPMVRMDWEPDYPLPTYRAYELLEGGPPPPAGPREGIDAAPGRALDEPELERALRDVGSVWADGSNGGCDVRVVHGDARGAVAALSGEADGLVRVPLADAVARLVWTAASGGAYGRRPGMAAGRASFWWLAHHLTGLPYPSDGAEVGAALESLRWFVFGGASEGWNLRLALDDPADGRAAVIEAWDAYRPGDTGGRSPGSEVVAI